MINPNTGKVKEYKALKIKLYKRACFFERNIVNIETPVNIEDIPHLLLKGLKKPIYAICGKYNDKSVKEIITFCDDKNIAEELAQIINEFDKLKASHEKLKKYARHKQLCNSLLNDGKCDCGYDQAIKEAGEI